MLHNLNSRAQSAVEYLMIITLTLGIIVPTAYLFYKYSLESNVQLLDSQINQIGIDMLNTAGNVYFFGEGSRIRLELNMPRSVNDIYIIGNRELVFNITTETGEIEAVFFSQVNITSNYCAGDICSLRDMAVSGLGEVSFESVNNGKQVLISRPVTAPISGFCGDGNIDPGEECDGANLNGETCTSQGFDDGTLACNSTCKFDTSGCYRCGDGTCDITESCLTCSADCGSCPITGFLLFKDGAANRASFDENGNFLLYGFLLQNYENPPITSNDEFVVKDAGGNAVAVLDLQLGVMYIKGLLLENQPTLTPTSGNDFIVKNPSGDIIAYIDGVTGDFYLKGVLIHLLL